MSGSSDSVKGRYSLETPLLQPQPCRAGRRCTHRSRRGRAWRALPDPGVPGLLPGVPSALARGALCTNLCSCSEDATMQQTSLSPRHLIAQSLCESWRCRKMERFKGEMKNNAQLALPQQLSCSARAAMRVLVTSSWMKKTITVLYKFQQIWEGKW